jgi:hypothetical protein
MKKNHGDGGSHIKTLLLDKKNAAVEDGPTRLIIYFWDFAGTGSSGGYLSGCGNCYWTHVE